MLRSILGFEREGKRAKKFLMAKLGSVDAGTGVICNNNVFAPNILEPFCISLNIYYHRCAIIMM